MAKKIQAKVLKLTPEEQLILDKQFRLKEVSERLPLIPDPTYKHNIGDRVSMGNLEDVHISAIHNENKIYEIDYTSINNNRGNPIRNKHQWMFVTWMDVRKYIEAIKESFIENRDVKLNYSQRGMGDIFTKAYHFGINFEPEYQREFVWNLEDKVSLIDSIFHNVDIGKFTFIHYSSDKWLETGYGYEILDGKQRLRAILDFYEDRFTYKGKLFSELSDRDQYHFRDYGIVEAEARNLTQEQILRYFIMLNTGGRIMAKEQIEKVRGMLESSEEE